MVEIITLFAGLEVLVITVGIVLALLQLRDVNKTRQAELFTALRETMDTTEFWMKYKHIVHDSEGLTQEEREKAVNENPELYGETMSLMSFYQHIGWLVKTGLLDMKAVGDNMALAGISVYEAVMPSIQEFAGRTGRPQLYENFDYLYKEMKRYREQRLERLN
jgi:hypothetical protein